MQIQKGLVKYKDRTDIVCTYGLKDDGSQYYFLDDSSMPNGNIVASTVLVEAIDPVVVASSVGVIDSNGNVVIPFENRMIKVISEGFLLVERADITTPSVLEAISLRSDPLAATRLVTTPASIKDNMYLKMGNDGRFIFNDQFSEASVFDIYGNNILNDEYFSFIAIKDGILYLSKNTVDSQVLKFSLTTLEYVDENVDVIEEALDVTNVEVPQEVIDNAMNLESEQKFGSADITAADFESVSNDSSVEPVVEDSVTLNETLPEVHVPSDVVDGYTVKSSSNFSVVEPVVEETIVTDPVVDEVQIPAQEEKIDDVETSALVVDSEKENDIVEFSEVVENTKPRRSNKEISITLDTEVEKGADKKVEVPEEKVIEDEKSDMEQELVSFDFGDDINFDDNASSLELNFGFNEDIDKNDDVEEKTDIFTLSGEEKTSEFDSSFFDFDLEEDDIFANSKVQADKIVSDNYATSDFDIADKDTIIDDVASTMSNLIKLNRSQRDKIMAYEEKIDQIVVAHKKVVEKAKSQARDTEILRAKIRNYETAVSRFEAKIQLLEERIQEQERLISSQLGEIERLKPQVESRKELARILADAQNFLEQAS